jgi:hypothetical protein
MLNQIRFGNSTIMVAQMKLQITDAIKDFFLQKVSANVEVGNSKIHIHNVNMFEINIISAVESQVYL